MFRIAAAIGCLLLHFHTFSQSPDSSRRSKRDTGKFSIADTGKLPQHDTSRLERLKNNNIFQFFRNAVSRGQPDSAAAANTLNTKSETPFITYEGKVIRHIMVRGYGFEQNFVDTSKRLEYFGTKILNHLHHKTRDWVIRNSLFIKENTPLNAFKLADNERLIRSLEYVQDARILVNYIPDNPDSVDLVVVVKDLFSIGGAIGNLAPNSIRGNVSDANAFGLGQKIELGTIIEQNRSPHFAYQLLYTKSNISHTFVNASLSYTQINNDLAYGIPDEQSYFIRLDRPLFSPYALLAGSLTLADNQSFNRYRRPDSLFYQYHYRLHDAWLGWNLGGERFLNNTSVRDRKFLSVRYLNNHFLEIPTQVAGKYNFRFNDREAALAQFTFFRQDFYKTNYIYGFGTTEDVPEGYNVALTGGWYRQLNLQRAYAGVEANHYVVTSKGFFQYFLRSGTFMQQGKFQDASFLVGGSLYSRLFLFERLKIRQYINFSFSRQFNRVGMDPLTINNLFGLRYFSGDSTFGSQRITLHSETTVFTNYKFLGFKFAAFAFGDLSLLTPEEKDFSKSALYHGIGAGLRTRNENLVFGTIELRCVYFPRKTMQNNSFKIMITTDLQFRYNSIYVKAPDIAQPNMEGPNATY
jgi:hypothetical protein